MASVSAISLRMQDKDIETAHLTAPKTSSWVTRLGFGLLAASLIFLLVFLASLAANAANGSSSDTALTISTKSTSDDRLPFEFPVDPSLTHRESSSAMLNELVKVLTAAGRITPVLNASLNVSAFDGPLSNLSVASQTLMPEEDSQRPSSKNPLLGWVTLHHDDATYGVATAASASIEYLLEKLTASDDNDPDYIFNTHSNPENDPRTGLRKRDITGFDPAEPVFFPVFITEGFHPPRIDPWALPVRRSLRVIGVDARHEVACTQAHRFPYSAIVDFARSTADGQFSWCSGALIGRDWVLTSAHCLYSFADSRWTVPLKVHPHACDLEAHASYRVAAWSVHAEWQARGAAAFDLGLLRLQPTAQGAHAGDAAPFLAMKALPEETEFKGALFGYPAKVEGQWQLHRLWGMLGRLTTGTRAMPHLITREIDTSGGQSGAPTQVVENGRVYVVGIHRGWFRGPPWHGAVGTAWNDCVQLTPALIGQIEWLKQNATPALD